MSDPTTFLSCVCMYNLNQGYENYTHRLLSLLKGMGFAFGQNLATEANNPLEKETSKAIAVRRNDNEVAESQGMASVALPTDEQAHEIKHKLETHEQVTKEERLQLKITFSRQ